MPTLTNMKIPNRVPQRKKHIFLRNLFFVVIILTAAFFLLQSSFFNIEKIVVKGNKQLKEKDMVKVSGLVPGINIFKANLQDAEKNIRLNPLVKEVELKRNLPNQVEILVDEREPIGLIAAKNCFVEVDKDGVYLAAVTDITQVDYPIITGDVPIKGRPGDKVVTEKIAVAIKYLAAIPKDVYSTVSEINVANLNQMILYTLDGFQVRLGGTDKINEKGKLYQALMKQQNKDEKLEYIDIADVEHPAKKPVAPKTQAPSEQTDTAPNATQTPNNAGVVGSIPD